MRTLPRPPRFVITTEVAELALRLLHQPDARDYLWTVNKEYYHWEKLRHRPTLQGLSPEQTWLLVKWSRMARTSLPLVDERDRPFSYWLPDPALAVLHEIDRGGGSSLAVDETAAPSLGGLRDRVLVSSLMEEAIATSQIE